MKDKKIIYVHTGEWPSPSPSIVFATGTAFGLAHHASAVLIIRNNSTKPTKEIFQALTGSEIPDRLEIVRVGYSGKTPGHFGFFREAVRKVGSLAKRGEAGAVITRSIGFLPYLTYIRKRYSLPCFFETHDFFSDLGLRTDLNRSVRVLKNRMYEHHFLQRLDGLICLTDSQKILFKQYFPSLPVTVARTGLLRVERLNTIREKQVCYVGSLERHKGLGTVFSAFDHTTDRDLKLFVIGGKHEHEKKELMDFAHLIGVEDRVRISGWVHHSDVGYLMDTCIAGIVPLRDTPFNRHITSPLKILDCFSRSLPVIGSDLPPVRELVEDGKHGLLYTPDRPESLAEVLDRYVAGNMFDTMSREVEKHAADFLWSKRGETIIKFISSISQRYK